MVQVHEDISKEKKVLLVSAVTPPPPPDSLLENPNEEGESVENPLDSVCETSIITVIITTTTIMIIMKEEDARIEVGVEA